MAQWQSDDFTFCVNSELYGLARRARCEELVQDVGDLASL